MCKTYCSKWVHLKGFWGQDVKQIQEQLETIPWVKGAVVRKIWPNRLSIWLSEYQPVAIWNKTEFVTKGNGFPITDG